MELISLLISLMIYGLVNCDSPYRPKTIDGEFCVIPFEYNGKTYHDCTSDGDTKPWCMSPANKVAYCQDKPNWGSCDVAPSSLSMSEVNLILNHVNNLRAQEPALRMTKLRWNSELTQRAQFISNQCKLNGQSNKLCSSANGMGQIGFYKTDYQPQPKIWETIFNVFYNNKSYYDFSTNKCSATSCVGYQLITNAKTSDIGCAVTSCNQDSRYNDYYHCEFYPPNYMNVPYEQGSPKCDKCYKLGFEEFYRCNSNLCEICDNQSTDCKSLKTEIAAGRECIDMDEEFCAVYGSYCSQLNLLDDASKTLMTTKCQKTCKLC